MTKLCDLKPIKGKRADGDPVEEAEHFYICKKCGQAVDMRDLNEVMHHEEPGHKPLEMDS